MLASSPGRRRSRPVADAPALDGAEVAKAWLVELVARSPLERAAQVPGPRFADDAPRLCAAVAAALSSDPALEDLEPGGSLAPLAAGCGHLAAAPSPTDAVAALDALRAATWAALLEAVRAATPVQVAELAERLATVVATLTAAALESPHPLGPTQPGDRGPLAAVLRWERQGDPPSGEGAGPPRPRPSGAVDTPAEPAPQAPVASEAPAPEAAPPQPPPIVPPEPGGPGRHLRVADGELSAGDALAQVEATLRDAATAADPLAEAAARLRALARTSALDLPDDPFDAAATRLRSTAPPPGEPLIRRMPAVEDGSDFRAERVAPWTAAIDRRLGRHAADGRPFAVLCVELADVERLTAGDLDPDTTGALEDLEAAVLSQLRPADALVRERAGRYWLTTPDTDATDARALAHRIAGAVADLPPHRGAPLQVAVGVTTCPADGTDAATLEGRAEEGVFSARASGTRVAEPPPA